ncbi:ABC transporter ATP-binding protein [Alicyclobacillus sp. ALC3]|uniref:ABC transporter ATP-binding protein n=1 Tax=Alicyclobacillus sp. ALC3 TaxID=2796143 RepID=UPI00237982B8|nr:ABC transporter transmembrane domain-containing protein [Alicyclobacillus sp. ALC3]WDL98470.1 ATP-binding cassette domain-containing protein [Alicyclobacillus sp. ALC3]
MFIVLRKLFWFFWEQRTRYGIALLMLLILNFVEVAPPELIGKAIDGMSQGTLTAHKLVVLLGIFAGLVVVMYAFGFTWQFYLFGGANRLQRTLRSRLMRHFLKMTPTFFEKNRTGDLMAKATNDLNAVSQTAGFGILTLIDSTTFAATILVTMATLISWKLTLLSLIPLPLMAIAMTKYGKLVHERFTQAQDAFGDMNDAVLETIAGIRVVRAYVQEEVEERRFGETTEDVYRKNVAVAKIDSLFDPSIKLLVGITYLIGLGYGSYMVFQSQITLGQLTSFNIYLGMLIWPMLAVGELINIMQRGNASLDRVSETLAYSPDVVDAEGCQSVALPRVIEFRNYTFRYPLSSQDNLRSVNLKIQQGETLGIVGRTGSGKTTLIKQLLREYPLGRGELLVNGLSMQHVTLAQVHGWLGYVPQESMLFSRTVEENVRFGRADATEAEVLTALERAAFAKDLTLLPNGLNTLVGEKGISLSGGQKQRIALARALILDPEILILDDAMSAVDARTEVKILDAIRRDRKGKTTLIATHRLSAIEHADFIIVLDHGSIVEAGTHHQLIAMGGWYKEQYDRQQTEDDEELEVISR